jgi:hypothetical protein
MTRDIHAIRARQKSRPLPLEKRRRARQIIVRNPPKSLCVFLIAGLFSSLRRTCWKALH